MPHPRLTLSEAAARVAQAPATMQPVTGTGIRLSHLWKRQIESLASTQGMCISARVPQLVSDTYRPYPELWRWLSPEEEYYEAWAPDAIDRIESDTNGCLRLGTDTDFMRLFSSAASQLHTLLGLSVRGDWYILYAGAGNLGGSGGVMYANLERLADGPDDELEFMLPHELNHQLYHDAHPNAPLTLARSVVEEGLCCFVNRLCTGGDRRPADHIGFTVEAWDWAVSHESEVVASMLPHLDSSERETIDLYHYWHNYPWDGAVDRLAYFVGYRLSESYVRRHGDASVHDFYRLTPLEIWERSGYLTG